MIKARLDREDGHEGGKLLVLGLSHDDMMELLKGKAIQFNISELGLPDQEVLVLGGTDEASIIAELDVTFGMKPGADQRNT